MKKKTFIKNIDKTDLTSSKLEKIHDINIINSDHDKLSEHILDLSLPQTTRIHCMEKFYKDYGLEDSIELINR